MSYKTYVRLSIVFLILTMAGGIATVLANHYAQTIEDINFNTYFGVGFITVMWIIQNIFVRRPKDFDEANR